MSEIAKDRRTLRGGDWLDLDKCPKSTNRLLADAVGIAPMTVNDRIKSYTDLDKCPKPYKIASSRVRVWGSKCFWRILQKRFTRGSRSGVGLVPVAVNEYSPQKCRCKPGAGLVSAGVPPASVLQALENSPKAGGLPGVGR